MTPTPTTGTPDDPGPLLTAWQVALRLGCCRATVYALVKSGQLPAYRFRRLTRFRQSDVVALMQRSRTGKGGAR